MITEAIKRIYPNIQGGFVYFNTKPDLTEWEDPIEGLVWENLEYDKPTWEQISEQLDIVELEQAKEKKIGELKALRESRLRLPTPQTIVYQGNLSNRTFDISVREHLPIFESIISTLGRKMAGGQVEPTREWTDSIGERLNLELADYASLADHLNLRDEQEHGQYNSKKNAIEALETLEEVENYDINQIV